MTFNSNLVHNAINVLGILIGIVGGIMLYAGCKLDPVLSQWDCSNSMIPPQYLPLAMGFMFIAKMVMNIGRDGVTGLTKVQPPVADKMTTVVIPAPDGAKVDVKQTKGK